ncbi:LOW QUALITY PROTEIN: caspase recruitment domain-containing protein 8 [Leptonychotes weddellii]|uniref:LOW QUALITY PROTEIN: caspase recruitment domain-containing protein 8 n=1 Tax=Leptonychotes weddellii TaxID=9713 RepID=A0A7F8RUR0_LEPWE|nr:LOW QUALITY PROTEIN: caspase recruitment domain-containing protein 8 [Leptonychotes weddellii]
MSRGRRKVTRSPEAQLRRVVYRVPVKVNMRSRNIRRHKNQVPHSQEARLRALREETCLEEKTVVPLQAPKLFSGVEPACKSNQFLGPEGNVDIELIDKSANGYSVHFPMAGFYLWPATHLGFLVQQAVTMRIAFDSWGQHLDLKLQHEEQWMVAGPLFEVSVEPKGVITEIPLPHIISLPANEVNISWFQVAHFKDEGMVLEPPARVKPFCAVLENPSFSLMGILLRIASGTGVSVPITSTVLIYYHFHPEDTKFHLYLIPSDSLLMKAIDDEEAKFHGVRLQTSPPVDPLNFGSRYIVSSSPHLEIMPKELKLSYRSPGEIQVFSKVYAGKMEEPIVLNVTDKRHKTLVWHTLVKPDFATSLSLPPPHLVLRSSPFRPGTLRFTGASLHRGNSGQKRLRSPQRACVAHFR